jgi:exonuclease VII small subunit
MSALKNFQSGAQRANFERFIFAMKSDLQARSERAFADLDDSEPLLIPVLRAKLALYGDLIGALERHELRLADAGPRHQGSRLMPAANMPANDNEARFVALLERQLAPVEQLIAAYERGGNAARPVREAAAAARLACDHLLLTMAQLARISRQTEQAPDDLLARWRSQPPAPRD